MGAASGIAARIAAAALGGFALANAVAALVVVLLAPQVRAEVVTWATMLAFPIHLGATLWAFGARTALRAWIGIGLPLLACLAGLLARL